MRVLLTALALMAFAFFLNVLGDLSAQSSTQQAPALAASVRAPIIPEATPPAAAARVAPAPEVQPRARPRREPPRRLAPAPAAPALEVKASPRKNERRKLAAAPTRPTQEAPATPEAAKYAAPAPKALAALGARKRGIAPLTDESPG